jgi:hypothetical protein
MNRAVIAFLLSTFIVTSDAIADYAKWTWSQQLPTQLACKSERSNRTPDAVDKFFHGPPHQPSIQQVLNFLRLPDGFSPQFMYSKTKGTSEPSKAGGTLRFLLDDGGEVHIWTTDYRGIGLAIRHRKQGKSELLYK